MEKIYNHLPTRPLSWHRDDGDTAVQPRGDTSLYSEPSLVTRRLLQQHERATTLWRPGGDDGGTTEAGDSSIHSCNVGLLAGKDTPRCLPSPRLLSSNFRGFSSSWFRMEQWSSQCSNLRNRVHWCWLFERCSACVLLSLRSRAQIVNLRCLLVGFETKTCSS